MELGNISVLGGNETSIFCAQLVLPEQRRLFDVWAGLKGSAIAAERRSITPSVLGSILAFVTVFEVNAESDESQPSVITRIAGSSLRQLLGFEPQGRLLEVGASDSSMLGRETIVAVSKDAQPRCGTRVVAAASGGDALQVWMRLPLLSADGKTNAVLGLDRALPMSVHTVPSREARRIVA